MKAKNVFKKRSGADKRKFFMSYEKWIKCEEEEIGEETRYGR
jgi:hypothetical protein